MIREFFENVFLFCLVLDLICGIVFLVVERGFCFIVKFELSFLFLFLVVLGGLWIEMKCNGYNLNLIMGCVMKIFYLIRNVYVKISFL